VILVEYMVKKFNLAVEGAQLGYKMLTTFLSSSELFLLLLLQEVIANAKLANTIRLTIFFNFTTIVFKITI